MNSHIYLDESGDLGWKLNKPFRNGGSSRFLTIGYLLCPITHINIPKRLVRDFYRKFEFDPKKEVKASDLKPRHREYICAETVKMLKKYPEMKLGAMTVNKSNVLPHMRLDSNKLYNYMIGLAILESIAEHVTCKLSRDNRSVKIINGNNCVDYLQTCLWYHLESKTVLTDNPTHSHTDDGVIFIDWITNIVWTKHEDKYPAWRDLLGEHLEEKLLFFRNGAHHPRTILKADKKITGTTEEPEEVK